jgi:hypothetical protein
VRRVTKIFRSFHRFLRHARAWGAKKQHTCYTASTRATVASEPLVNQMRRGNVHVKASRKNLKIIYARFHTFHRMGASQERASFFSKLRCWLWHDIPAGRQADRKFTRKFTRKSCPPASRFITTVSIIFYEGFLLEFRPILTPLAWLFFNLKDRLDYLLRMNASWFLVEFDTTGLNFSLFSMVESYDVLKITSIKKPLMSLISPSALYKDRVLTGPHGPFKYPNF